MQISEFKDEIANLKVTNESIRQEVQSFSFENRQKSSSSS